MRVVAEAPIETPGMTPPGSPPRVSVVWAFFAGWVTAAGMPLILLLTWGVNLVFAAVATLPIATVLSDHIGHSDVGRHAFAAVDFDTVAEFTFTYSDRLAVAALALAPVALAYLAVTQFLMGGVLDRLCVGRPRPWSLFFDAGLRFFWPFTLLTLFAAALCVVLVVVPNQAALRVFKPMTDAATSPDLSYRLTWVRWGVAFFLLSWVARVYDYARIALVLDPARGTVGALARGVRFTLRYGTRSLLLWTAGLAPLALFVPYNVARAAIGMNGETAMWVALVLGQAFVLVRILGRFAALGGEAHFMYTSR